MKSALKWVNYFERLEEAPICTTEANKVIRNPDSGYRGDPTVKPDRSL